MRRFLLRNAAGEQIGEGVEWTGGGVAAMAASLLTFSQTQNALTSLGELGLTIDWLDPEPRKPYTGPVPCIAVIDGKQIPGELVAGADGKPVFRLGPLADQLKG